MERKYWTEPFDARLVAGGVRLERSNVLGVRNARGALVFVESGTAWITQENDPRDVLVAAGEWFRFDRDGTALVQAHRVATVTVTAPAGGEPPELYRPGVADRPRRGTWLRGLQAAWLRLHRRHPSQRPWTVRPPSAASLAHAIEIERGRFV